MSQFAIIDEKYAGDIASIGGWSAFCDWCDGLDLEPYSELISLSEHGISSELPTLKRQLAAAMTEHPPTSSGVREVGNALLVVLQKAKKDADYIIISDGADGADLEGVEEPEEMDDDASADTD